MVKKSGMRAGVLLAATALVGSLVASHPASAQDAAALQAIQQQIQQLQAELRRLQRQAADRDAALKRAQDDATQARSEASRAMQRAQAQPQAAAPSQASAQAAQPSGGGGFSLGTPNPNATSLQSSSPASITGTSVDANKPVIRVGALTLTLGGYIDTTAIYRSRNLTSSTGSPFNSIPYANSPNYHIDEFRMSAQPTRVSALAEAPVNDHTKVGAYLELDFSSSGVTANSNETNSYNPRIRNAYAQYDDLRDGWHFLFGQSWSLATAGKTGIIPRQENIPIVIDQNYLPGWVYTRQPQVRVAKSFDGKYWLGASLEAPQAVYSFGGVTGFASGSTLPPFGNQRVGDVLTFNQPGGTYLNSTASYSYDTAPDIIVKAAADPGYGHYEAYGLGRWFKSRSSIVGGGSTRVVFGGGVGGSAVIPIVPKYVDLVGNVLGGYGVGRYGAGQLPDASFKATGEPAPLPEIIGMAGIVGHPNKSVDLYGYVGTEQIGRSTFTTGTGATQAGFGYGTPFANTSGCNIELGTTCNAQTRALSAVTVGTWWRFLHGSFGTMQAGASYSYVKKIAFRGTAGRPSTDDNIAFFTLRYLPFQ